MRKLRKEIFGKRWEYKTKTITFWKYVIITSYQS
jgi:hypothetical protein